jgi:hypothetical protein
MRRCHLVVLVALALAACAYYDPTPGTIHLLTTYGGQPRGCRAQVWTAEGKQIQDVGIEGDGRSVDIRVAPGTYTLKFLGHDGNLYPATVEVQLYEAGEVSLTIDLSRPGPSGTITKSFPEAAAATPDGG